MDPDPEATVDVEAREESCRDLALVVLVVVGSWCEDRREDEEEGVRSVKATLGLAIGRKGSGLGSSGRW